MPATRGGSLCDGCGAESPVAEIAMLWLKAPLGLCAVHTHRNRECAAAGRERKGGGRFYAIVCGP